MFAKLKGILSKNIILLKLFVLKVSKTEQDNYPRFVIIARSRTGSTMLINYLSKVPNSFVVGEIMGRRKWIFFWKKIPVLFFEKRLPFDLVGFKYFYYHPVDDYDANNYLYNCLGRYPEVKLIHWLREDLFAVVLSRFIAEKTGAYAKRSKRRDTGDLVEFAIDEIDFRCELEKSLAQIAMVRRLFSGRKNYMEMTYEDIVDRGKLNEVFEFLEVDGAGIVHEMGTRQYSDKKYRYITNIDRLRKIYDSRIKD